MTIQTILCTLVFSVMIEASGCALRPPPSWDLSSAPETAFSGGTAERDCREPIPALFERVSPSVVSISAIEMDRFGSENSIRDVVGSRFIFSNEGLVLTNSHVVFDSQAITVTMDDGSRVAASLLGADPIYDLAVIRIPVRHNKIPTLVLGNSDLVRIGEDVIAIGNPLALEQTLTRGVVSGLNRFLQDSPLSLTLPLIQTDAPNLPWQNQHLIPPRFRE